MPDFVVPDLNAFVLTSRVKDVQRVFDDAADAERLGFKRLFVAERYDLREAGALLGGVAARTPPSPTSPLTPCLPTRPRTR